MGLPEGLFLSSLIGFNLGVEAGQIAVIAITAVAAGLANWLLRALTMRDKYPHFIVRPASALIGVIGLYWGCERLLGVG